VGYARPEQLELPGKLGLQRLGQDSILRGSHVAKRFGRADAGEHGARVVIRTEPGIDQLAETIGADDPTLRDVEAMARQPGEPGSLAADLRSRGKLRVGREGVERADQLQGAAHGTQDLASAIVPMVEPPRRIRGKERDLRPALLRGASERLFRPRLRGGMQKWPRPQEIPCCDAPFSPCFVL